MGAVVGAAFAAGSTYDRFVEMARSLGRKDVAALDRFALVKGVFAANIFKPEPLQQSIARLVPATRFAQLEIPLTVTATDVDSGELVLFGELGQDAPLRSEEHTSELQSQSNLVCRLLLEKKKKYGRYNDHIRADVHHVL